MDVEFLGSFTQATLPDHSYPEIAVGGRSNVGKSSFINALVSRRRIAHVSSTPGKTRTINLYLCNRRFVLADLPGYGFSRASRAEQARWTRDIESYMEHRTGLRAIIILVDGRHPPMPIDTEAIGWFSVLELPLLVVFTKMDRVKRADIGRRQADIAGMCDERHLESAMFSAKTGLGKKDVWSWIEQTLKT
jgi:GTP-binding protein